MTYLDWAATARPDPDIIEAMAVAAVRYSGNPSSPYPDGKEARTALTEARRRCADMLGTSSDKLAFTSGGTEANNIVLMSRLLTREPGTILISGLEHPSTAEPARALEGLGWTIREIPPETDGRIAPERVSTLLEKNPDTRLVAVMGVNNETGAVMPLDEIAAAIRRFTGHGPASDRPGISGDASDVTGQPVSRRPIHFHADLVQTVGKVPLPPLNDLDVDTASFAAHKIRGPRGVGLLYHRNPKLDVFLRGGGQEHGIRPGTENVAGALAMAMALEKWGQLVSTVTALGSRLLDGLLKIEGAQIIPADRVRKHGSTPDSASSEYTSNDISPLYAPGIISAAFPPIPGEVLTRVLAESGFEVSTGSACSNNRKGKLPKAMVAMGVAKEIAAGMIRISVGPTTTEAEIESFLETLKSHVRILGMVNKR